MIDAFRPIGLPALRPAGARYIFESVLDFRRFHVYDFKDKQANTKIDVGMEAARRKDKFKAPAPATYATSKHMVYRILAGRL